VIDRLPEPPSPSAVRGTLVHRVLELLFDARAGDRDLEAARALLPTAWDELQSRHPEYTEMFADTDELEPWLARADELLATYFAMEDPSRLEPAERELWVETVLPDGPALRGVIDRLDVAPDGAIRVVDYKTGKSPTRGYEAGALFQMRFYAVVLRRTRGELPRMLQLVYLGDGQLIRHQPTEAELDATEQKIRAIWSSIEHDATEQKIRAIWSSIEHSALTGDWRPRTSRLCDWCAHRAVCPAFGGEPPELSPAEVSRAIGVSPATI
jgi:putative RecB family exonuclease